MHMVRATLFSFGYRLTRWILSKSLFFIQHLFYGRRDLETLVDIGDKALTQIYASPIRPFLFQFNKLSLKRDLFDLSFASPVTFAAFKDDFTMIKLWREMGIGGGVFKTIMPHAQPGNLRPRMQEARVNNTLGFINALGLPGKGVPAFIENVASSQLLGTIPLGFSIGGNSEKDYLQSLLVIDDWLNSKSMANTYFELNISCPNTDHGRSLSDDVHALETLLKDIRSKTNRILVIKLSPDQSNTQLQLFTEMISCFDRCAINAGNTQFKTREALGLSEKEFTRKGGGLSGPFLFKRTHEMLKLLQPFNVPLISTGGVSDYRDVQTLLQDGATLVGMASQLVKDPYCIPKINAHLRKLSGIL